MLMATNCGHREIGYSAVAVGVAYLMRTSDHSRELDALQVSTVSQSFHNGRVVGTKVDKNMADASLFTHVSSILLLRFFFLLCRLSRNCE
jgi:hypothetical protein